MDVRLVPITKIQANDYNPNRVASPEMNLLELSIIEDGFNLVHLLQSKDRIHRLGLADNQYTQYYYMQSKYIYNEQVYSLDDRIYHRLMEKEKIMLDAIDHDILEKVTSFEEDLKIIFQDF